MRNPVGWLLVSVSSALPSLVGIRVFKSVLPQGLCTCCPCSLYMAGSFSTCGSYFTWNLLSEAFSDHPG